MAWPPATVASVRSPRFRNLLLGRLPGFLSIADDASPAYWDGSQFNDGITETPHGSWPPEPPIGRTAASPGAIPGFGSVKAVDVATNNEATPSVADVHRRRFWRLLRRSIAHQQRIFNTFTLLSEPPHRFPERLPQFRIGDSPNGGALDAGRVNDTNYFDGAGGWQTTPRIFPSVVRTPRYGPAPSRTATGTAVSVSNSPQSPGTALPTWKPRARRSPLCMIQPTLLLITVSPTGGRSMPLPW